MPPDSPNLFLSLFDFHPRETHTPKENFLTEAFAYLLRTDPGVPSAWVSRLRGEPSVVRECTIDTRQSVPDPELGTTAYPDLVLKGRLSDGTEFHFYCEHKWDSQCNAGQLWRYTRLAESKKAQLAFVGATIKQHREAVSCFPNGSRSCFLWEDVFKSLAAVPEQSMPLKEFLRFMEAHELSPGNPISVGQMQAFLQSGGFLKSLDRLSRSLLSNYSWDAIPKRYRENHEKLPYVEDRWGRVALCFDSLGWKPGLALGFLYSEHNHRVKLVNRERGIDLFLRIGANENDTLDFQPVLDVLVRKREVLRTTAGSVLVLGDRGNGNRHSVLIVQDCLADVIGDAATEQEQLARIHARLNSWVTTLFDDGDLEAAFGRTLLSSGLPSTSG